VSTSGLSVNSAAGSPLSITGLASGLDTSAIVSALMGVEREPVTRLTQSQEKLQGDQSALAAIQTSLQQLTLAVSEFALPTLYESAQSVSSSQPTLIAATASVGAVVGGHEVEVTQLATAAQRAFTFTSPAAEQKITIGGVEYELKAGETSKELAAAINSDSSSTVYASAQEDGTIVLSTRTTGNTGAEFVNVSAAGVLAEVAGSAREGRNAEFTVDGVAGTSASNTVTNAIAGVTLTLTGLTSGDPVTIDVQPPGASTSAIESQVQSFVKLYNTTIASIQKQLTTKPPAKPSTAAEYGTGTLFGDLELGSLLGAMRETMYEPITGMAAEMSSLDSIGVSTGAAGGAGGTSSATLEGQLTVNTAKLAEAVRANPTGVEQMLAQWSKNLQVVLNGAAEPGGSLEARINGDSTQITNYATQISSMNEILAVREKALIQTYATLEGVISQNDTQSSWLASQSEQLTKSGA
jgi:flagellar hook-associated protein 2